MPSRPPSVIPPPVSSRRACPREDAGGNPSLNTPTYHSQHSEAEPRNLVALRATNCHPPFAKNPPPLLTYPHAQNINPRSPSPCPRGCGDPSPSVIPPKCHSERSGAEESCRPSLPIRFSKNHKNKNESPKHPGPRLIYPKNLILVPKNESSSKLNRLQSNPQNEPKTPSVSHKRIHTSPLPSAQRMQRVGCLDSGLV